jgi:sugar-specific transcriptional regulator TrmB
LFGIGEGNSQENEVEILVALGLTIPQGKVFRALTRIGKDSPASKIASFSKMARTDVYRVLEELQEVGLVEKIIATPTKFQAVPIREAVFILTEKRNRKTAELRRSARELIRLFEHSAPKATYHKEDGQFRIVPKREALIIRKRKATSSAKESIDHISNWTAFQRGLDLSVGEVKQALDRGVKMRSLVDKPKGAVWPEIAQALMKHDSFKLRAISNPPITRLSIYDKKEVIVSTYLTPAVAGSSALMSTNPALIGIIQCYFDDLWNKAKEDPQSVSQLNKKTTQ